MWWSVTLEFLIKIFKWCYISLVFPLLITSVTTLFLSVINKHLSCCACYMFPWPQNSLCPYLHSWSFVNPLKLKVMCYHFQVFPFYFMIPVYIQIMSLLVPVFNESIQFIIKHFVVDGALYIPVKLKDMWADSILFFFFQPGKDSVILPASIGCRLVFIPLFMLCNVHPRAHLPVVFYHDCFFILFMILFAFSNGYLASLCMCYGPR